MYNTNGVGVVKIAEEGMGFIATLIFISMLVVFLFHTLDSAGQQVGLVRDLIFSVYQNNTGSVAKNTLK